MNWTGLIQRVAVVGALLVSAGAVAQDSTPQSDAPLADDAFEGEGPGTRPVASLTRRALREERDWLDEQQPSIGDLIRPSIFLTAGAAASVVGVWWLSDFMRMNPAYRGNAEWLAIGTMAAGAILSGVMGALIGSRVKRRTEYQERIAAIRGEFRRRELEPAPPLSEPTLPEPPGPPPPIPAPELLTPPPPPPPSL